MTIEFFFNRPNVLLSMAHLSDQALLSALEGIKPTRRVVFNKNNISGPSDSKKEIKYKELCNSIGEVNVVALSKDFSIMLTILRRI